MDQAAEPVRTVAAVLKSDPSSNDLNNNFPRSAIREDRDCF